MFAVQQICRVSGQLYPIKHVKQLHIDYVRRQSRSFAG